MLDEDTGTTGLCMFEDVDAPGPPVGAAGGAGGAGDGGGGGGGNIMPTKFASASRTAINLVQSIQMQNIVSHNAQSLTLHYKWTGIVYERTVITGCIQSV